MAKRKRIHIDYIEQNKHECGMIEPNNTKFQNITEQWQERK